MCQARISGMLLFDIAKVSEQRCWMCFYWTILKWYRFLNQLQKLQTDKIHERHNVNE